MVEIAELELMVEMMLRLTDSWSGVSMKRGVKKLGTLLAASATLAFLSPVTIAETVKKVIGSLHMS